MVAAKPLQRAAQLGVKLTIIDDASAHGFVRNREGPLLTFFPAPNFGKFSLTHPEEILSALRQYLASGGKVHFHGQPADPNPTPIAFDGVFTLVEDHGPITAYIAEGLGLKGSPYKAAQTARSKLAVRQAMQADRASFWVWDESGNLWTDDKAGEGHQKYSVPATAGIVGKLRALLSTHK